MVILQGSFFARFFLYNRAMQHLPRSKSQSPSPAQTQKARWIAAFSGVLALLVLSPRLATAEPLTVATSLYPPYVVADEAGHLSGYAVEAARTAFKKAGYQAKFTVLPYQRLLAWLEKKKIDATFPLFYTAEQEAVAVFPKERLLKFEMVLMHRRDAPGPYDGTIDSLSGQTVAWVRHTSTTWVFDQARLDKTIEVLQVKDLKPQVRLVAAGRVDYAAGDRQALADTAAALHLDDSLVFEEPPVGVRNAYLVFAKKPETGERLSRIESALSGLRREKEAAPR